MGSMPVRQPTKVEMIEFSPDGKWLAYYVDGVLHLVDVSEMVEAGATK